MSSNSGREISAERYGADVEVFVYDRRKGDKAEERILVTELKSFKQFHEKLREVFKIDKSESFVIVNTNRGVIDSDETYERIPLDGQTLYILKSVDQELSAPTHERVEFIPHYDTLVKSGIYEYYASEGQNPLPFAFAELVDNALAATADNKGLRKIEIQLMFDESLGKPVICVWDNGGGMTSKVLNNWAIYRLSKFNRDQPSQKASDTSSPGGSGASRYLNSDISWFGVGGKQAIFFIGNATRMITKTNGCGDVHELCISKEEFERKEQRRESVYSGQIYNRRPGDCVHISEEEENIRQLIRAEEEHASFTSVVITGISASHVQFLKHHFEYWCHQLANIYHYYLHGPRGNERRAGRSSGSFNNFDIQVVLYEKGKQIKRRALKSMDNDLQSQYIRSTASAFEFRAHCEGGCVVEGILRYHPFLYDRETYPQSSIHANDMEDHESLVDSRAPRGNKPIFQCYWNGRLIPYTTIDCLDWCSPPKKRTSVPPECYYRFSGALWTNDAFQVSTNKLTFIDLEVKLKDKNTIFNRVVLGQEQRAQVSRAFHDWIRECHDAHDKQVKFTNFKGTVKRTEFQKHRQSPWCVFHSIEWDGKVFSVGDLIKTQRSIPAVCGTIKRFLLFGDHDGDVYATGGEMEIIQEPRSLYGDKKIFPLAKLDRSTSVDGLKKFIAEEEAKLPSKLLIEWPNEDEVLPNAKIPVGSTIGDMKVDILNGKGESISKLPGERGKRLLVEMKIVWHGSDKQGDKVITQHVCQHGGKSWPYWFRKFGNITCLGSHTLYLQVIASDSMTNLPSTSFPSHKIKFVVTEGQPEKFTVGVLENPLRIAVPFQIPLNLLDAYGNPSKPTGKMAAELTASGLELTHEGTVTKGNSLIIKGVTALGTVSSHAGKDFNLKVVLPGLEDKHQTLKIRLLPGPPHSIEIDPAEDTIEVENGSALNMSVQVKDKAGNVTVQPKLNVVCKMSGSSGLPTYLGDCSTSGKASLTGSNIVVNNLVKKTKLKAKIELQSHKDVSAVEKVIYVVPSTKASIVEVYHSAAGQNTIRKLNNEEELPCVVGEIITGLSYKILDEGKRELEIDNTLATKVKVNWMNKVSREIFKQGSLPDIKAPTTVNDTKFCQVTFGGATGLEFSFTLVPLPDKPSVLKCSCSNAKMQLGEQLKSDIVVSFSDKFGNQITKLSGSPNVRVSGDGLVEKSVKVNVNKDGSVAIKNIEFRDGNIGVKEVTIKCEGLTCHQRIEVRSGPPAQLKILNLNVSQPIGLFSHGQFPKPISLQLCDVAGNACSDSNVKIVLNKDSGLKLNPTPPPQKSDAKGQASFSPFEVSGQRGNYEIRIKALVGRTSIDADSIRVRIDADPNKPVKLNVERGKFQDRYVVGTTMKDFWVHVVAEDERVMKCNPKDLVLRLWQSENVGVLSDPPNKAVSFQPNKKTSLDKENHYYFRNLTVPEQTGPHCIVVTYSPGGAVKLKSDPIQFNVFPGLPVKLVAVGSLATPTVSNTHRITSRYLVRNLKFQLKDKYDNVTGKECSGKIEICINKSPLSDEVPMLQGNIQRTEVPLTNGAAVVQSLSIEENTPGKDGQEYILSFTACLTGRRQTIPAFKLPFLFYNDARKQQQMAQLTKERDHLFETIKAYRSLFDTTRQLMNEMKVSVHEASIAEQKLRTELRRQNVPPESLSSMKAVDSFIAQLSTKKAEYQSAPRRHCTLNPGPRGEQGILGKIAHLAQVIEDDIARVLSWHMASDMDCVVTLTTEKAKKVYKDSNGQQQVLPLDSIYKRNLPEWNKPLPHERSRSNYQPPGHPIYARSKLIFPAEQENCRIVFGMLLGDTLILDNLDCANSYRQAVVKFAHCPTILTRNGDRIRSNGKFGGLQNKAPPVERLRGVVFASPLPSAYHTACSQLEQFKAYKQAMIKHDQAKQEYEVQLQHGQTPEMKSKHQECREAEIQLRRIEERLGMTPVQYDMPASPATMLQSATGGSSTSRTRSSTRGSPGEFNSVPNGQPTATTPARSRRSTTAPDSYGSPSKRPRRS